MTQPSSSSTPARNRQAPTRCSRLSKPTSRPSRHGYAPQGTGDERQRKRIRRGERDEQDRRVHGRSFLFSAKGNRPDRPRGRRPRLVDRASQSAEESTPTHQEPMAQFTAQRLALASLPSG